jgi:aryl-alcohol dehydrogenase-like predicted oxidoreductase
MMQLGLGTAQVGMPYGISNQQGQTTSDDLAAILTLACEAGIRVLDTAALYGNSESELGAALGGNNTFRIVTKTPNFEILPDSSQGGAVLKATFERSLSNLHQHQIYGLLVHNVNDLLGPDGYVIWRAMEALREQGLVEKIGVSVYTAQQIDSILSRFDPTLIQVPVNIIDQRLIESGHLAKLKGRNTEIHARSIFLQGLLMMKPEDMPHPFQQFSSELSKYTGFLAQHGLSPVEGALSFIRQVEAVDVALVGVNCPAHLQECISAFSSARTMEADFSQAACHNETLLNPALWPVSQPSNLEVAT